MITLITGGVKAGKSRRALEIACKQWTPPISFIATAYPLDDEMNQRIARHQKERAAFGGFVTIEEPIALDRAIAASGPYTVVDCIPMWINNLMYYQREADFSDILKDFIQRMTHCVLVSNETGLGNIPFDETTRRYNILLAEANRRIAEAADAVEFMISGIPLKVK
ncbi:MAG: bifunctional adenosylcobinamide kinase/adenosylcobinamide-phosphate guanylyltransferase [Treponema sp.]|jgi:adenosylcobinamide kinase/adenosylcobinamide-phosphate guanylyltransferase|nr:bifunctional adenosylcobinamide kinase/adenosylcobinamide-phosphate guanylyltransferase [Treponema sp.]